MHIYIHIIQKDAAIISKYFSCVCFARLAQEDILSISYLAYTPRLQEVAKDCTYWYEDGVHGLVQIRPTEFQEHFVHAHIAPDPTLKTRNPNS